jgi:hypothetical protein
MTAIKLQQTITPMRLNVQDNQHSSICVAKVSTSDICSVEDLVTAKDMTTVVQLKAQGMEQETAMAVQLMLCEYLENISLRSSMTQKQIELCSRLMIEKHPHLPFPSAFNVFFMDALCKKFGDHYGRMDIPTLMGWLQQFEQNYFEQVEEQAYQEHVSTKGDNANFVDILQKHKALAAPEDEAVPMPDDFFKNLREKKRRKEIEERVHKENMHLYSHMSVEEADSIIDALIKNELSNN